MPNPVAAATRALEFRYVGGDASADFVNTVDWTARGLVDERLSSYARLTAWAEGAGLLTAAAAREFRADAARRPDDAGEALAVAHDLRGCLHRAFTSVAAGDAPVVGLEAFDERLRDVLAHLRIAPASADEAAPARWGWRGWEGRLDCVTWPVAWRAALLLTGPDAERLRTCAFPDCGWVYVDRSRNGLRRWCQMETCGTRAKSARRAGRL